MDKQEVRKLLIDAKRIVIKVGTSTLTYPNSKINFTKLKKLVRVISDLLNQEREVVLVTSGAIGVGVGKLKLKSRPKSIQEKQAIAAVGQCELMHIYSSFFSDYGHIVAQILLTRDVIEDKKRRSNVINTFNNLIKRGVLPVVNENDTVSVEEIENITNFGDNDTLSAIVSELISADLLIILSDVEGFYESDPRIDLQAKMLSVVSEITEEIEQSAGGIGTNRGTGGMTTKIFAAKIATKAGVNMVLSSGEHPEILTQILQGDDIGTLFIAKEQSRKGKK